MNPPSFDTAALRDTLRQQSQELEELRQVLQRQQESIAELKGMVAQIPELERMSGEVVKILGEMGIRINGSDGTDPATGISNVGMNLDTGGVVSMDTAMGIDNGFGEGGEILQQLPIAGADSGDKISAEAKNRAKGIQQYVRTRLLELEKKAAVTPNSTFPTWNYTEPLTSPSNQSTLHALADLISRSPSPNSNESVTHEEAAFALEKLFNNRRRERLKPDEKKQKDTVRKRRNTRLHLKSERRKEVLEENADRISREGLNGVHRPIEEIRKLLDVRVQSPEVTDDENDAEGEGQQQLQPGRSPLKKRRVLNRSEEASRVLSALDELAPDTLERLRLPPPPQNDGLEKIMPQGLPTWAYSS
ncbi:uncharacterized protein VTP21DRAFT_1547 [Calcarisporiella thermophila]|uniref:uncharacterized protein n=1 Tax=Calcarisporiella thermophila TaxID=911321 RepID=UPI0037428398